MWNFAPSALHTHSLSRSMVAAPWVCTKYRSLDSIWAVRWLFSCTDFKWTMRIREFLWLSCHCRQISFVLSRLVSCSFSLRSFERAANFISNVDVCELEECGQCECDGSTHRPLYSGSRYIHDLVGIQRFEWLTRKNQNQGAQNILQMTQGKVCGEQATVACLHLSSTPKHRECMVRFV